MLATFPWPTASWVMTMRPEHVDLRRMVDRLNPDQVRALRAVARPALVCDTAE
jgi:hypothetical protein